jgi:hypothetical protein
MTSRSNHKRKLVPPAFAVAGTASSVSFRSQDQRRQRNKVGVVGDSAGPSTGPGTSRFWEDDLSTSQARAADSFSYGLGDNSLESQPDEDVDDGINVVICHPVRNPNSVRVLSLREGMSWGFLNRNAGSPAANMVPIQQRVCGGKSAKGGMRFCADACALCRCEGERPARAVRKS